jgi:multidrug resistance efflux pump
MVEKGGVDAVVTRTGGTRAQRKLRAAQNDVHGLQYALSKAEPALKHAQAQVDKYRKQLDEALADMAKAEAAVEAEVGNGGAPEPVGHRAPKARKTRK